MSNYQTLTEKINISGIEIALLRITNVDELYTNLIAKGEASEDVKDERIPYWADLWASAIGLSEHLIETEIISQGISIHEMGCGLGLPGITAGKLGAKVLFSDYLDEALDFAKQNWELNKNGEAQFEKMDWRNPNPEFAADILLASDIAYEKRSFEFLPAAFKALTKQSGKIIVSEPNRLYAQEFFNSLSYQGFSVVKFNYDVELNHQRSRINVFEIALN